MTSSKDLCTSLTADRRPCNSPRFGWSSFCWYHQPWPEIGLATVIALLVGVNATWFIAVRMGQWTRELTARISDVSTREPSHRAADFELPNLKPGERIQIGAVGYRNLSHEVVRLGDSDYELDHSPDGGFSLSGEIRERGGRNVVAQLKNSRLFVSPGLGYDINADANALEVVDPESHPVLQFARDENGLVGWVGTYQKSGEVLLCGNPCATASEAEALPILARQHRIFRYPGFLHPGARER